MNPDAKKKLIGAIIAAALAVAVYYGVIDQKQADSIRTQADQTLGTNPGVQPPQPQPQTTQQQPQPAPQPPAAPAPANPQSGTPAPPR